MIHISIDAAKALEAGDRERAIEILRREVPDDERAIREALSSVGMTDQLTAEQREFWDETDPELPDLDDEEAFKAFAGGLEVAYQFDSYPVPSRAAIRNEVARRARPNRGRGDGGDG